MHTPTHTRDLGDAILSALADTWEQWQELQPRSLSSREQYALHVEQVEIQVTYKPGGVGWIVTNMKDRRPGLSIQDAYRLESAGNHSRLFRLPD